MTATPTKKKLCWNCDGNVPLRAEHCPYCGVYIEQSDDTDDDDEQHEDDDHAPPYQVTASKKPSAAPVPPYATNLKKPTKASQPTSKVDRNLKKQALPKEQLRRVVLPLILLICGSVFAFFGLVLLLFSDNGVFVLKWNGDHWPIYLIVGIVALAIGWRLVGAIDEPAP
jgi:hypothetical protein